MSASFPRAAAKRPRGYGAPLLLAAICVAGLAVTWVLAALVPLTHDKDAIALYDFTRLNRPIVEAPARLLLDLLEPAFFIVWGLGLVAIALSQGRKQVALAVVFVLSLAPASAELLKPLLAHPHAEVVPLYIKGASWPSGHATAATALLWCVLLVAPLNRRRALALVGVVLLAAVGCSLLILAWHMPSDVIGGYLLGTLWFALALLALRASRRAPAAHVSPSPGAPACSPGAHSNSEVAGVGAARSSFAARLRINSMSDSRFK
jgi:membrane-associated phospholipid phosphatase